MCLHKCNIAGLSAIQSVYAQGTMHTVQCKSVQLRISAIHAEGFRTAKEDTHVWQELDAGIQLTM